MQLNEIMKKSKNHQRSSGLPTFSPSNQNKHPNWTKYDSRNFRALLQKSETILNHKFLKIQKSKK